MTKGEEEELEATNPGNEHGKHSGGEGGGEREREGGEEVENREEREEPEFALGDFRSYEIGVAKRGKDGKAYLD